MKMHVIENYPETGDEAVLCDDCFNDFTDEEKAKLVTHELTDMDSIEPGDRCEGSCKRELEMLIC